MIQTETERSKEEIREDCFREALINFNPKIKKEHIEDLITSKDREAKSVREAVYYAMEKYADQQTAPLREEIERLKADKEALKAFAEWVFKSKHSLLQEVDISYEQMERTGKILNYSQDYYSKF